MKDGYLYFNRLVAGEPDCRAWTDISKQIGKGAVIGERYSPVSEERYSPVLEERYSPVSEERYSPVSEQSVNEIF